MKDNLYFLESAEEELAVALDWYSTRSERAAAQFLDEIEHTLQRIRTSIRQFPTVAGPARRALLGRFPFAIVFRETPRGIEIIAIAHARRRPGYWRGRVTT